MRFTDSKEEGERNSLKYTQMAAVILTPGLAKYWSVLNFWSLLFSIVSYFGAFLKKFLPSNFSI